MNTPQAFSVSGLVIEITSRSGHVTRALDEVDLALEHGRSLAIVGESGAGKSTLASVLGRLEPALARKVAGSVHVAGQDVYSLDKKGMRALRHTRLGFVSQDPIGSLNPTMRIGRQLALVLKSYGRRADKSDTAELLSEMRIADPERALRLYPHEVSGGMAQRIAIALALISRPALLIADEPTAALDSNVREEVIRLLFDRARAAGTSIVWLSHDLSAVSRWCDEIAVMRAGRVVERGITREVFAHPAHRYTAALMAADPARARPGERLRTIDDFTDAEFATGQSQRGTAE